MEQRLNTPYRSGGDGLCKLKKKEETWKRDRIETT